MTDPPSIDSTLTPSLFPDMTYNHGDEEEDEDEEEEDEEFSPEESITSGNETNSNSQYDDGNDDNDVLREDHASEEDDTMNFQGEANSYTSHTYNDVNGDVGVFNSESLSKTPEKSNSNYRYSVIGGIVGCCYGYTCFAIVFFAVVIVGSVMIKMTLDNGRDSSPITLAPTSAPGSGPVIAIPTSPTKDTFCPDEHSQFESCLVSLGSSQTSCEKCFNDARESTEIAASCDRINYQLCTGVVEQCPTACRACSNQFEKWNTCFFEESGTCEVKCDGAPENEPEAFCESQIVNYRTCLEGVSSVAAAACVECVNGAIEKADQQVMCSAFHSDFCTAFGQCEECGSCMDTMEEWMHCMTVTFNNCNAGIDCDRPKEPCDDEMVSYHSCLGSFTSGGQLQSCIDCVRDSFETAIGDNSSICSDIQESFCLEFDACDDCGGNGENGCRDQAETYVSCLVTTNGCGSGLDCERQPDPCGSEIDGYQACLATIGNQANVTTCRDCVNTAVELHQSAECDAFNDGFCLDFQLCDTCQPCSIELKTFVTCRMLETWDCSKGLNCTK